MLNTCYRLMALGSLIVLTGCATIADKLAEVGERLAFSPKFADKRLAVNLHALRCEIGEIDGLDCDEKTRPRAPEYPTPAQPFRPSVDVRSVIGGRGEGLSCSIPGIVAKALFPPPPQKTGRERVAAIGLHFRQSCATHDYCYRHGLATYGYKQTDCDVLLYDGAFRACSAIYRTPGDGNDAAAIAETIAYCRREAALVLLGVTKFGGKAFRGPGESTFFEFDPLARATRTYRFGADPDGPHQGFSVARVLPQSNTSTSTLNVFDIEANGWTVRDSTASRSIAIVQANNETVVSRGARRLAPPQFPPLKAASKSEALVVVQRDDTKNTGIDLYAYQKEAGKFVAAVGADQRTQFECNTPVNMLVHQQTGLAMFGLGIAPDQPTPSGACRTPLRFGTTDVPLHTIRLNGLARGVGYRFTQHTPLFGNFGDGGETLVLGRGYRDNKTPGVSSTAEDLVDYRKQVTAFVLANGGETKKRADLDIQEDDEPVVAMRLNGSSVDTLVSLRINSNREVCAKLWDTSSAKASDTPCTPIRTSPQEPPLDGSWLAMPPQVVRTDRNDDELLVFSRVCAERGAACADGNEKRWTRVGSGELTPENLELQSLVIRVKRSEAPSSATFTIQVTTQSRSSPVNETVHLPTYLKNIIAKGDKIRTLRAKEFLNRSTSCKDQNFSERSGTCAALLRDSAIHWRQAQSLASVGPTGSVEVFFVPHPFGVDESRMLTIPVPR